MPDEQEIELDSLHERIHEAAAHDGGRFLRVVALTTALLAALAALGSLQAGATVNEALLLKTESTQLQSQASDQWAYYQAKGIKGAVAQGATSAWQAAGKPIPPALTATVARYAGEQRGIANKATQLEHDRDARSMEADHLLHRHHGFANAVALFQVAIALGAITALTRSRPVFGGSLLLGAVGVALLAWQYIQ